jgi:hypothetical protein
MGIEGFGEVGRLGTEGSGALQAMEVALVEAMMVINWLSRLDTS